MHEPPTLHFVEIDPPAGGEYRLRQALAAGRHAAWHARPSWAIAAAVAVAIALGLGLPLRAPSHGAAIEAAIREATLPVEGLRLASGSALRMQGETPGVTVYQINAAGPDADH